MCEHFGVYDVDVFVFLYVGSRSSSFEQFIGDIHNIHCGLQSIIIVSNVRRHENRSSWPHQGAIRNPVKALLDSLQITARIVLTS